MTVTFLVISAVVCCAVAVAACASRWRARLRRSYVRLLIEPYRSDRAGAAELAGLVRALRSLVRIHGVRRLLRGQPSLALELHCTVSADGVPLAWLAVCCPDGVERQVGAALRGSYPNCSVRPVGAEMGEPPAMVRLRRAVPIWNAPGAGAVASEPVAPATDRLLAAMAAAGGSALVQIALAPAPGWIEQLVAQRAPAGVPSGVPDGVKAPRAACGPLLFGDLRIVAGDLGGCRTVAAELGAGGGGARLAQRRRWAGGRWAGRLTRGELGAFLSPLRGIFTPDEIAALWGLPSPAFTSVPMLRRSMPRAPAPPGIARCAEGLGLLRDDYGPVTIERAVRRQNTAVVGTVEQGKTSFLSGNLTRDPELRALASGNNVCGIRLATNSSWRNSESAEWEERPNFFDVSVFGGQGEACARYLVKGKPIAVDGRLEWREWETPEGDRRQAVQVIAEHVQFLGAARGAAGGEGVDDGAIEAAISF